MYFTLSNIPKIFQSPKIINKIFYCKSGMKSLKSGACYVTQVVGAGRASAVQ